MTEGQDVLTIRGLQEGFDTPLRKFTGTLDSYGIEDNRPAELNFTNITVIESVEPYPFPSAVVSIWPSTKVKSKWGVFGVALGKFIQPHEDLRDCCGKVFGMMFTPGHMLPTKNEETGEWKDLPKECWEVYSLDGAEVSADGTAPAAVSPAEKAMQLLDGKNLQTFNQAAMADTVVRADPEILGQIVGKTFVQSLLDAGLFTMDGEGTYHKV